MTKENKKNIFNPVKTLTILFGVIMVAPVGAVFFKNDYYNILLYHTTIIRLAGLLTYLFLFIYLVDKKERLDLKGLSKKLNFEAYALLFMMVWMLASCLLSDNIALSMLGDWRGEGYLTYLGYFAVFFGAYAMAPKLGFSKLWRLFAYASYAAAALGLLAYNGVLYIDSNINLLSSVFVNSNHYGYYLAVALILSVYNFLSSKGYGKWGHAIGIFLISFSLFLSGCRGAWLGAVISLVIFTIIMLIRKEKPKTVVLLPIFITALSFAAVQLFYGNLLAGAVSILSDAKDILTSSEEKYEAGTKRWLLWTGGISLIPKRPFFGFGLDNVGPYLHELSITHTKRVHNEYLQYILSIGIVGALAYFSCLFMIILRFIKNIKNSSLLSLAVFFAMLAYLGSAFFGNTTPYATPLLFICMGFLNRYNMDKKNELKQESQTAEKES